MPNPKNPLPSYPIPLYLIPRHVPVYEIRPASAPPPLDGAVRGTPWADARTLRIARYPWFEQGIKQSTEARLLYDKRAVYVQFRCRDRHISASVADLNGPVCEDSCVEFFATPHPGDDASYFNLESNCCGVIHLGWGPDRYKRRLISAAHARDISIAASEDGPPRCESPADLSWWVAMALPFEVVSRLANRVVRPRAGSVWMGNFYRCGGRTDPQYASWLPIAAPQPDYHRPEQFGVLRFV